MSYQSPRLGLPYIAPSQAQKHVTHNEAIRGLDSVVQLVLVAVDAITPPASPEEGDAYALGEAPELDWAGQGGRLAIRDDNGWSFVTPQTGWFGSLRDTPRLLRFGPDGWSNIGQADQNLDGIGIGSQWDATNRLSVASDATLFSHDGAGHQVKLNKAGASDTASLLFQSNWAGHAEVGLAGDTALSIKVSQDGSSWHEALRADPVGGNVTLSASGPVRFNLSDAALQIDVPVTGAAVQSAADDGADGKLLTVGAFGLGSSDLDAVRQSDGQTDLPSGFYGGSGGSSDPASFPDSGSRYAPFLNLTRRIGAGSYAQTRLFFSNKAVTVMARPDLGSPWEQQHSLVSQQNVVGAVSETGGSPTGAVIERGENGDGSFVRLADGTQICWGAYTLSGVAVSTAFAGGWRSDGGSVDFPASFAAPPVVHCECSDAGASDALSLGHDSATVDTFAPRVWRASQGTADFAGTYIAVGRWF